MKRKKTEKQNEFIALPYFQERPHLLSSKLHLCFLCCYVFLTVVYLEFTELMHIQIDDADF